MNEIEFLNLLASGKELPVAQETRYQRFTNRTYKVIGKKTDRRFKEIVIENVSATMRKKEMENLRARGYNLVSSIETDTVVNEKVGKEVKSRNMEFAQQAFAAANNKFVPKAIETVKATDKQATIAWELFDGIDNAWLDNRPLIKVSDRNAKVKAERKRMLMNSKKNYVANHMED